MYYICSVVPISSHLTKYPLVADGRTRPQHSHNYNGCARAENSNMMRDCTLCIRSVGNVNVFAYVCGQVAEIYMLSAGCRKF